MIISGIENLRSEFYCKVYCSEKCNQNMKSPIKNGSKYFKALFIDKEEDKLVEAEKIIPIVSHGDVMFELQTELIWEAHKIVLTETPGHSSGSICVQIDDKYLFTGDSLLKDVDVITRLPGGSKIEYESITLPYLQSLSKDLYIYPGHGESGYLKDFNILTAYSRDVFINKN